MNSAYRRITLGMVLAAAVFTASVASAEIPITGQNAALRVQYAKLEYAGESWGWDPVFFGYYDWGMDPWAFSAMLGYGSGWDIHAKRWDLQLSAGRAIGPVVVGAGWHYIKMLSSNINDDEWYEHGPELMVGGGYPFGDTGFSVAASGTLLPYVWTGVDNNKGVSDSTHTWGWTIDGRVNYAFLEQWRASLGYRYMRFNDADLSGDRTLYGDRFHGPYIECGYAW